MTAGFDAALVARQQEKYRYLRDEQDQRALFESSNSTSSLILLNADKVHGFNFTLGTKLGQGGFGAVYIARSILTDSDQFVAKIEPNTSNSLLFEAKVYDTLSALGKFSLHLFVIILLSLTGVSLLVYYTVILLIDISSFFVTIISTA